MIKKTWKRWLLSAVLAAVVMFADTVALAQLNKWYRPGHPPAWASGFFYYLLAWPLPLTRLVFPRAAGDADEGPSFAAVASAGLIDLLLLTLLVYALLSRRARRKERAASV
ncbi:MAG TPA: hypothetical protein VF240_00225 [Pyrinomonadaceae bacterium]